MSKKRKKRGNKNKNKNKNTKALATTSKKPLATSYKGKTKTKTAKPVVVKEADDRVLRMSISRMREICLADDDWFKNMPRRYKLPKPEVVEVSEAQGLFYAYFDNGGDVLAVAHLDSVSEFKHFEIVNFSGKRRVYTPSLDDRLGAWVILDLLRQHGLNYDILLTTGEETGQSTAQQFTTKKDYNWIFEFDRTGVDCVMYEYEDKKTERLVEKYGWDVGVGSFTDICELEDLGCKGFNFGVGYYDYHGRFAYAHLPDLAWSVQNFIKFFDDLKDTKLEHENMFTGRNYRTNDYPSNFDWYSGRHYSYGDGTSAAGAADSTYKYKRDEPTGSNTGRVHAWKGKPREKIGRFANDETEMPLFREACEECYRATCYGVEYCEWCGHARHDDKNLYMTGICTNCEKTLTNNLPKCKVCDDVNCVGMQHCDGCDMDRHNDKSLMYEGSCSTCLSVAEPCAFCDSLTTSFNYVHNQKWYICSLCEHHLEGME